MPSAFILAGEASGDRIGAALMSGLKQRAKFDFSGVGGEAMIGQGLQSLFPIDDLAVMGYADVIARLPLLLFRARQVVRTIMRSQPDIVVLIDAQVFSQVVAKGLRKRGYRRPILLYVAPSVWAWKPERAPKLVPLYDEVLAVLPFEPETMRALNGPPTVYVGHPALSRFTMREIQPKIGPLLLLPGSRAGELRRHLPLMHAVAQRLVHHSAVSGFVIPTPENHLANVRQAVSGWQLPVEIVADEAGRQMHLRDAVMAFAVSGTATLELALAGVPHALTYVAEGAQVRMFAKATTAHIGLPNIVAGKEIVPELLFAHRADPGRAIDVLVNLLDQPETRAEQVNAFVRLRIKMEKGVPEAPLSDPVERIMSYLG